MTTTEQQQERGARHVLAWPSMQWCMKPILAAEELDWTQIEAHYPQLSSGEQVLVQLASYIMLRPEIASVPTTVLPEAALDTLPEDVLKHCTHGLAISVGIA